MPEYRPGLWKIDFTAGDRERAHEYARQAGTDDAVLVVIQAGRYGWSAVGTHEQAIALRDAVIDGGESFAITRATMAELHPDGQKLRYEGDDRAVFREQVIARLGFDPAEDNRWEMAGEFLCPARLLDVVLHDLGGWTVRQEPGPG